MVQYLPSYARQRVTTGQSWRQGRTNRIIGSTAVSGSTSSSAGSANRVWSWLKQTKGNQYAYNFFKNATFGPFMISKSGTRLVYN